MTDLRVNVVGAGRVGQTFMRLFAGLEGVLIQNVCRGAQAEDAVGQIGQGRARRLEEMAAADLWLVTVPDGQIAAVAEDLAALSALQGAIVVHCSGFHPADVMAPLRRRGCHLASCHPVLTFADAESAAAAFPGTFCGVEGDPAATDLLHALLPRIGAQVFAIRSDAKALYHGAAVVANNFTVVLQALAAEAWAEAGVSAPIAQVLGAKLLDATAQNVAALGPQEALTGPAARGDTDVVTAQAAEFENWSEDVGALYRDLSGMATRLKTTGRASR